MVGMASNGMDLMDYKNQSPFNFIYDPTDVLKNSNYWLRRITRFISRKKKKMKILTLMALWGRKEYTCI
jgi:hypothetical protein